MNLMPLRCHSLILPLTSDTLPPGLGLNEGTARAPALMAKQRSCSISVHHRFPLATTTSTIAEGQSIFPHAEFHGNNRRGKLLLHQTRFKNRHSLNQKFFCSPSLLTLLLPRASSATFTIATTGSHSWYFSLAGVPLSFITLLNLCIMYCTSRRTVRDCHGSYCASLPAEGKMAPAPRYTLEF